MSTTYIIDTSALTYAVWGKVLGVDKSRSNFARITCREIIGFAPSKRRLFECTVEWGDGTRKRVTLSDTEIRGLLKYFASRDRERLINNIPHEFSAVFDTGAVTNMRKMYESISRNCKNGKCYTVPEIPIIEDSGHLTNSLKATIENKSFKPDPERAFNKALRDIFKEYNIKVLVDKDTDRWFLELYHIPNASEKLYNKVKEALSHLGLPDSVHYDDVGGLYKPVIRIYDVEITTEGNKQKANVVGYAEVSVEPAEMIYVNYINHSKVTVGPRDIAENENLRTIYKTLLSKAVEVEAVHEALKGLKHTIKIAKEKEGQVVETYYTPKVDVGKSIIDTYIKTIKKENIIPISADKDIFDTFGAALE